MTMASNPRLICIDDTRFIFTTNFSGDPARDTYGDDRRKCNIIIPSEDQAKDITKAGFKVKTTKPRKNEDPNDFKPEYYIETQVKYRKRNGEKVKYPPKIYLVPGNGQPKIELTEESIGCLDHIRVKNVNVVLNPWERDDGSLGLYIRTLYVEQDIDDDPYAARYADVPSAYAGEVEEDPF